MLYKTMAYKDEYEVARLALKSDIVGQAKARFGPNAKVSYQLKPPMLKSAGYDKKIAIPEAAGRAMFEGLKRTKRMRGKALDPFGRTEERRIERQLIDDYRDLLTTLVAKLNADNYELRSGRHHCWPVRHGAWVRRDQARQRRALPRPTRQRPRCLLTSQPVPKPISALPNDGHRSSHSAIRMCPSVVEGRFNY